MGKCFSAMKGGGGAVGTPKGKTGKMARPANSNHMGPEGVENSIFHAKDEPLFPKRDPLAADGAAGGTPSKRDDDLNAEMGPLHELQPNENANAATPPKQAVMRRSFPPVGVSLFVEEKMEEVLTDPQRMAQVESEISDAIAQIFMTTKDRIRIMTVKPSEPPASVTINLNIVADRSDNDMRSPMQLAAELVTQSKLAASQLRQAPVFHALTGGAIAEDPFPGTKQDSWAGGVATLRPGDGTGDGKKKKKTKAGAAATGASGNASNAHTQAAPTTTATPRPAEQVPASPGAAQQTAPTAHEMAVSNTSELQGGTIIKDGGQYAGELLKGQRHGRGKQHYPNGDTFTGCFQNDKRFGIGRLDLGDNGGFYLGEWKDDERSGKGSLTYGNKDMYVGTWAKGLREGEGKLLWSTGAWYQGHFKKDELHGKGTLQKENQDKYEGEFCEGKMHGKGTITPPAGPARTGYWCMGEEIVGKTDDETQLMIREAVSKASKAPAAQERRMSAASDELAAKLQHRNARNEALAKEQQHQTQPVANPVTSANALAAPPSQAAQPEDTKVSSSNYTATLSSQSGMPMMVPGLQGGDDEPAQRPPLPAEGSVKDVAKPASGERRGMPPPPASSMAGQPSKGPASAETSKKASIASISEAKPPTRPQRSGANMSTRDTLKMVSDKLDAWHSSGATLNYGD